MITDLCRAVISKNQVSDNEAFWTASGICLSGRCEALILNNRISCNEADHFAGCGGGIDCEDHCIVEIVQNLIIKNMAASYGGGIYCSLPSRNAVNNVFDDNDSLDFPPRGATSFARRDRS